jgi:hypothetical protein
MDEVYKALNEIKELREVRIAADRKVVELLEFVRRTCIHPENMIVKKSSYFSGSYYDTAYTDHWRECTICGTKSKVVTEGHGYYG